MITIRCCGDWVEVFKDGQLVYNGHNTRPSDLKYLLSNFDEVSYKEISNEEMESYAE